MGRWVGEIEDGEREGEKGSEVRVGEKERERGERDLKGFLRGTLALSLYYLLVTTFSLLLFPSPSLPLSSSLSPSQFLLPYSLPQQNKFPFLSLSIFLYHIPITSSLLSFHRPFTAFRSFFAHSYSLSLSLPPLSSLIAPSIQARIVYLCEDLHVSRNQLFRARRSSVNSVERSCCRQVVRRKFF